MSDRAQAATALGQPLIQFAQARETQKRPIVYDAADLRRPPQRVNVGCRLQTVPVQVSGCTHDWGERGGEDRGDGARLVTKPEQVRMR
jgi:hypothetical protein